MKECGEVNYATCRLRECPVKHKFKKIYLLVFHIDIKNNVLLHNVIHNVLQHTL
jgi:hypothetical protein